GRSRTRFSVRAFPSFADESLWRARADMVISAPDVTEERDAGTGPAADARPKVTSALDGCAGCCGAMAGAGAVTAAVDCLPSAANSGAFVRSAGTTITAT